MIALVVPEKTNLCLPSEGARWTGYGSSKYPEWLVPTVVIGWIANGRIGIPGTPATEPPRGEAGPSALAAPTSPIQGRATRAASVSRAAMPLRPGMGLKDSKRYTGCIPF